VLRRNSKAAQIGLTATPRTLEITEDSEEAREDERIRANNVRYFGEPVYAYDIAQGIEDGYLAACEIVRRDVVLEDKGQGEVLTGLDAADLEDKTLTNARTGAPVGFEEAEAHYDAGQFEAKVTLPERTAALCDDLFACLLATGGPEQKTIVFCARDEHADAVARELGNRYAAWCAETGQERAADYAFKCTAASGGQAMLADFKGAERSHFIASTVDLLTTGVDIPALRNVVFFRYMRSPITFYQMIGRGTRIHEPSGKLMFRVFDYTDATRLLGEEFLSRAATVTEPGGIAPLGHEEGEDDVMVIAVEGLTATVIDGGRFVLMNQDGRDVRMPIEEYRQKLAAELKAEAPDSATFRGIWVEPPRRRTLIDRLVARGLSARVLQEVEGMRDYDSFDVLAATAYGETPRTRDDRAARFARDHEAWLKPMPPDGRAAVLALTRQFAVGGTEELETASVLRVPAVARAGGLAALRKVGEPAAVLRATRERLFA